MITRYRFSMALIGTFVASAALVAALRSISAAADGEVTLASLRPPAAVAVEPANRWNSAREAVAAADAIGLIRVLRVTQVPGAPLPGGDTAAPVVTGYGRVEAEVVRAVKGDTGALQAFSFDAFYRQGEILVTDLMPPLTEGAEYVVFIRDGRVMYPGGLYLVKDLRAWYIGAWSTQAAQEPPRGAWSGKKVDDVMSEIALLR